MNFSKINKEYKKNGVVLLKSIFSKEEIHRIKIDAMDIFTKNMELNGIHPQPNDDRSFTDSLFKLFNENYNAFIGAARSVQHTLSLHRLAGDAKIERILREIAGIKNPIICVKPIIYFNSRYLAKTQGHWKTPPHQDWRSMQGSLNSVVVWMPLVNIDRELGAVEFILGSHKQGLLNSHEDDWYRTVDEAEAFEKEFMPIEVEVGDVVLFSAFTIHRSGNNTTNNIRWSIHFRYNDADEITFLERNMPHPYIVYKPQQELLTPNFPTLEEIGEVFND